MRRRALGLLLALPAPLTAQSKSTPPSQILVSGVGMIETAPDLAILEIRLQGEGRTPDDASRQLAERQQAVAGGLRGLDANLKLFTGTVRFNEVRTGKCGSNVDDDTMALTTAAEALENGGVDDAGPCRVSGYRASVTDEVRTTRVPEAGTMVGLAGRLGAVSSQIREFGLRDEGAARRRATVAAMDDARARAQLIADAGKAKLGPVLTVTDPDARDAAEATDVVVAELRAVPYAAPPVTITVTPAPVRTQVRLHVAFALLP